MANTLTRPKPPSPSWSDKLAFEVALTLEGSNEPIATILANHNLTPDQFKALGNDPTFVKRVETYRQDIEKNGLTFKLKAKAQAELLLDTSFDLIHHPDVPAAVKADLIKSTVKWAGLEPQKEGPTEGSGSGVSIVIHLGEPATAPPMVNVTPSAKEISDGRTKAD